MTGEVHHRLVMIGVGRIQGAGREFRNAGKAKVSVMVPPVHEVAQQGEGVCRLVDHDGQVLRRCEEALRLLRCQSDLHHAFPP